MEDALAPAAVTPAAASPSLSHKCTVHPYLGSVVQFRVLSGLVRCCFLSLCACDRFGLSPAGSTGGLGKLGGVRCETRSQVATSFAGAARRLLTHAARRSGRQERPWGRRRGHDLRVWGTILGGSGTSPRVPFSVNDTDSKKM